MINVVLIGTCRILHPLRKVSDQIEILNESNLSFVHTTAEAIQRLNYYLGHYSYPDELSNYQLNSQSASLRPNMSIEQADIILIEISSEKIINFDEHYLQLNNLNNYMKGLGNIGKNWLSQLNIALNISSKIDKMFLKPPNSISDIDRKVMSESFARTQSKQELFQDLEQITNLTNGKVVFVTHINATPPEGVKSTSRTRLIQDITEFCEINTIPYINPTELLLENSQESVLDKDGKDINHYNPDFLQSVGEYLLEKLVPKKDGFDYP